MEKKKRKMVLDSKGICFLCLKFKNVGNEETIQKQSLRAMTRYLNPEIWKLSSELNEFGEVHVDLCHQCRDIMKYFTELYNILEETKLLLNGCLYKILGVMEAGRSDLYKVEEMKTRLQDSIGHKQLETLREKIMLKCDKKLKIQGPRVSLDRLPRSQLKRKVLPEIAIKSPKFVLKCESEVDREAVQLSLESPVSLESLWSEAENEVEPSSPNLDLTEVNASFKVEDVMLVVENGDSSPPKVPSMLVTSSFRTVVEPPPILVKCEAGDSTEDIEFCLGSLANPLGGDEEEEEAPNLILTNSFASFSSVDHTTAVHDDPFIHKSSKSSIFCRYCLKGFLPATGSHSLNLHLRTEHPEHYFQKLRKLSNLPPLEFKEALYHHLQKFSREGTCSMCDVCYPLEQPQLLFIHLIENHSKILEEKLITPGFILEFLKQTTTFSSQAPSRRSEQQYFCPYCSKIFARKWLLTNHIGYCHKNEYFPNMRKSHVTDKQFKVILDHLIFKGLIKDSSCSLCPWENHRLGRNRLLKVKIHLIENHHPILVEKLEQIQNDPKMMKESKHYTCPCGLLFSKKGDLRLHTNNCEMYKRLRGGKVKCPACKANIRHDNLARHRRESCPNVNGIPKTTALKKVIDFHFACYCELKFEKISDLRKHGKICKLFKGIKGIKQKCTVCGDIFRQATLERHKRLSCIKRQGRGQGQTNSDINL